MISPVFPKRSITASNRSLVKRRVTRCFSPPYMPKTRRAYWLISILANSSAPSLGSSRSFTSFMRSKRKEPGLDGGIANRVAFSNKSQFVVLLAARRRVGVHLNVVLHVLVSQSTIALLFGIALDVPLLDSIGGIVLAASLKLIVLRGANDFGVLCEGAIHNDLAVGVINLSVVLTNLML